MRRVSAILLLLVSFASIALSAEPTTRLYVKTAPPGAEVRLDGQKIGLSDDLFVVTAGRHRLEMSLAGYYPETREVDAAAGRITRLEVVLQRHSGSPAPRDEKAEQGVQALVAYLKDTQLPEDVVAAMLTVLRQHPTETRWSGATQTKLFGLAAKALPTGPTRQRATRAVLELTHSLAVHELLKAKSLLDRYAEAGLTDATTLRNAVGRAAGKLDIVGSVKNVAHQTAARDDFAVGYVVADSDRLEAHLEKPAELAKVKAAYRDVMHDQARDLMSRGNWQDAILLWKHLHARALVSQTLYLDAARCFKELGQKDDALRVLTEAMEGFAREADPDFLEQAGDVALSIDTQEAQDLAERAYALASQRLLNTVTGVNPDDGEHGN